MPTQTMKAIVQARYGDAGVLKYTDVKIPEHKAGDCSEANHSSSDSVRV